jgi:hypothetical protein
VVIDGFHGLRSLSIARRVKTLNGGNPANINSKQKRGKHE